MAQSCDYRNVRLTVRYEGNPKHKNPWQRGRRGSLCPREIGLEQAQILLDYSDSEPNRPHVRFALDGSQPYCARPHGDDVWHGFPVRWREVPVSVRKKWLTENRITQQAMQPGW